MRPIILLLCKLLSSPRVFTPESSPRRGAMFIARSAPNPSDAVRRAVLKLTDIHLEAFPLLRTAQASCCARVYKHFTPTE